MLAVFTLDAPYLVQRKHPEASKKFVRTDGRKHRWLVYKIVDIIRYHAVQHPAVIVSGIITNIFIIISIISAFPWVRK